MNQIHRYCKFFRGGKKKGRGADTQVFYPCFLIKLFSAVFAAVKNKKNRTALLFYKDLFFISHSVVSKYNLLNLNLIYYASFCSFRTWNLS
jgi:hypothetical protein